MYIIRSLQRYRWQLYIFVLCSSVDRKKREGKIFTNSSSSLYQDFVFAAQQQYLKVERSVMSQYNPFLRSLFCFQRLCDQLHYLNWLHYTRKINFRIRFTQFFFIKLDWAFLVFTQCKQYNLLWTVQQSTQSSNTQKNWS